MKKFAAVFAAVITMISACASFAYETVGIVPGTSVEYSGLAITKSGVNVMLTNKETSPVKVSLRLSFYDRNGNRLGYSLFGLRELDGDGGSSSVTSNYLNGKWKECKDAFRVEWEKMTFEILY